MLRLFYSALVYLVMPVVLLRLFWRARKEPRYAEALGERFGFPQRLVHRNAVWVHAVSAGETNAAAPLVSRLIERDIHVIMTTMTPTGRERVEAHFGSSVDYAYAPYDMPDAIARFLDSVQPSALVIVDTELWPNMIHVAANRGIRILLVNARLSQKSAKGYSAISMLSRPMLGKIDVVAAQTEAHGRRFVELGLPPDRLNVTGSIKFDVVHPADLEPVSRELRKRLGSRRMIVAASTHPGEEAMVLDALTGIEDVLLVIAPRHTRRSGEIESLLAARELSFVRHSSDEACSQRTRVYLLDTMGELMYFYSLATVAFVGGSLVDGIGGHNPLEPASLRVPIIMGPHLTNIEDIAAQFVAEGGLVIAHDRTELTRAIERLLNDGAFRAGVVEGAAVIMNKNQGALDRVEDLVRDIL